MASKKRIETLLGDDKKKYLEEQLDKVFNAYIMKRDKHSCILTGGQRNTNVSHLFGRAEYPNVRWDERNAHCMVKSAHRQYHESNPFPYIEWVISAYGEDGLKALRKRAYAKTHTYTISELLELIRQYVHKTQELPKCRTSNGRII